MIEVERLSKRYRNVEAVNDLNFSIGRGEIVGFLGPNGAGKTTTMRMLTTFLPPTSGQARLAGHDVLDESIEVRKKVGYLPENVPLYAEMRVRDYLVFRSKLKDVPRIKRRAALERVLRACRLEDMERRVLGHLSKGYRQRVGLADAMIHDPDILILDEPTAGLDPIQVREVRGLIKELGERHTILLSTHIMSEVEAVCTRVLMIVEGRIVRDQPLDRLQNDRVIVLEVRAAPAGLKRLIESEKGVEKVHVACLDEGRTTFEVQTRDEVDLREVLARKVIESGAGLLSLDRRRSRLEDWFIAAVRESSLKIEPATVTAGVA